MKIKATVWVFVGLLYLFMGFAIYVDIKNLGCPKGSIADEINFCINK